jgi:excisionase family DNA binding protein
VIHTQEEWLDVDQAAEWLKVPASVVSEAIATGQIPAMKIGSFTRISRSALVAAAGHPSVSPSQAGAIEAVSPDVAPDSANHKVPVPKGLTWDADLEADEGFTQYWPQRKDDPPDTGKEEYDPVWKATITLAGHKMPVVVGKTKRNGRDRLTVWLDSYPVAECPATTDGLSWASLIKPDSRKVLKPGEPIPSLYRGARVEPYRVATGLTGSGVPTGMAVVIDEDDLRSVVHHAAARWLRRQNLPVEVA